jgi:rare lipoprotein A
MRSLMALALPLLLANSAIAQDHIAMSTVGASAAIPTITAPLTLPATVEVSEEADDAGTHVGDGMASYYGRELAGNRTASGERFNPDELTAAHRTLAFGSKVRVTNMANGESVIVRINDRGPFGGHKRVIDVSHAAAKEIGLHRSGTARVSIALLD